MHYTAFAPLWVECFILVAHLRNHFLHLCVELGLEVGLGVGLGLRGGTSYEVNPPKYGYG